MRYRINRRTGDRISEIGLGTAYIFKNGKAEGVRAVRRAFEGGINYFDLAAGHGDAFPIFGEALHGVRDRVLYQVHFGADYTRGDYGWTLDLETVKRSVARMLKELRTDTVDYGFIHCQDELKDWETYKQNGILDYLLRMQRSGAVRHIGLSSHTPAVIGRILDETPVDMLMFSVNPAYDAGRGEYARGGTDERTALYRRCEREGIGISVMKPFSGGQLLGAETSPFGKALSVYRCLRYALDKPGVLTVLPGAQSEAEVESLLRFDTLPDGETDGSDLSSLGPVSGGRCVYCNHCKPCPAGIDVGLVNKYYDLARAGDGQAAEHYRKLTVSAADCTGCGHCDRRCPFGVRQSERMREIRAYMAER